MRPRPRRRRSRRQRLRLQRAEVLGLLSRHRRRRHLRRLLRSPPGPRSPDQDRRPRTERLHRPRHQPEVLQQDSQLPRDRKTEGRVLNGGAPVENAEGGYYIAPTVSPTSPRPLASPRKRSSGPSLAVIKSSSFDEALAIANNTEYGLTGAIYSASREKLDRAREEFHVGNLYLNRKCTGAMVGAHPFGGFNMSGTDSKAGGPDYLLLFTQAKSIAEKIGHASPAEEKHSDQMGM